MFRIGEKCSPLFLKPPTPRGEGLFAFRAGKRHANSPPPIGGTKGARATKGCESISPERGERAAVSSLTGGWERFGRSLVLDSTRSALRAPSGRNPFMGFLGSRWGDWANSPKSGLQKPNPNRQLGAEMQVLQTVA